MSMEHASDTVGTSLLICRLGAELFAIPAAVVREVARLAPITPIPGAAPVLAGLLNQRGTVMGVIEARLLLGVPLLPTDRAARLLICRSGEIDCAIITEAVLDLVNLADLQRQPLPPGLDPARARFLQAMLRVQDQPVALLDLEPLIEAVRTGAWA